LPKKGKKYIYKYPISISHAFVAYSLNSTLPPTIYSTYNGGALRWASKFLQRASPWDRRIPRGPVQIVNH